MLSVTMLGRMSVASPTKLVRLDIGPSGRLLAGYLFQYQGRVHRREKLAGLFWPNSSAEQAKAALNTALWRLRKVLGAAPESRTGANLRSIGSEVVLEPAAWLSIDSHDFNRLATAGLARTGGDAQCLESTIEKYSGCFMEGDDADWIITERERLHSLYVRTLCALVQIYAERDDFEAAIGATRKILEVDPFRENIARSLALLLMLNGQRAQAIRELDRWCVALRNEIDIEPLPETSTLRAGIASGAVDLDSLRRTYFVTRSTEHLRP